MLENVKGFKGVFSIDEFLNKSLEPGESYIANLDISSGPGTHWISITAPISMKEVLYYDSFGIPPDNRLVQFMKTSGKDILWNSSQHQHIRSNRCGFFAAHVIREINKDISFYKVMYNLDQNPSLANEENVKKR